MKYLIRKLIPCLFAVLLPFIVTAQADCYFRPERHDVGITGGVTHYLGDLVYDYSLFTNVSFYVGAFYRYNFNEYYALRGQVSFGELSGSLLRYDMPPDNNGETWNFTRPMALADLIYEIGFLPLNTIDLHKNQRWSPYLLFGAGFSSLFRNKLVDIGNGLMFYEENKDKDTYCGHILLGAGVKAVPWKRLTVSVEWMMRKTFSDQIDFYTGKDGSPLINKDWIGTLGLSFSYRLFENRSCAAYNRHYPDARPLNGKLNQ